MDKHNLALYIKDLVVNDKHRQVRVYLDMERLVDLIKDKDLYNTNLNSENATVCLRLELDL